MREGSAPPAKRRYTLSARVLAANRANLVKANAVDRAIRYRRTPKRLAACRRNLLKARKAMRRSPLYAVPFRHGLYCVSLRRSFALAREKARDFAAHVARFLAAFRPADRVEKKLARALAETAWRRLRAFRLQALWEAQAVQYCLGRAARAATLAVGAQQAGPHPATDNAALARLERVALELFNIFTEHLKLERALERFSRRLERLCRALLLRRGVTDFKASFLRTHKSERSMARWPLEVLNNPLVGRQGIVAALRPKRPTVRAVKHWRAWGTGRARSRVPRWLPRGLMRRALTEPGFGTRASGFEEKIPGPGSSAFEPGSGEQFEALLAAFEAALAEIRTSEGSGPNRGSDPDVAIYPLIAKLACATWERLQCFWHWAEVEAETLEEILNEASASREAARGTRPWAPTARGRRRSPPRPGAGRSHDQASAETTAVIESLATSLLSALATNTALLGWTEELNEKLEAALAALATQLRAASSNEAA